MSGGACWYTSVEVCEEPTEFLLDTGASVTLIDKTVYDKFRSPPELQKCDVKLIAANGEGISVYGKAFLPLTFGDTTAEHQTVVCNLSGSIGILGIDLLERLGAVADLSKGLLSLKSTGATVKLHKRNMPVVARVTVAEPAVLPPHSEMIINGRPDQRRWREKIGIVEPLRNFGGIDPILTAKCVVDSSSGSVPVRVANLGDEPVVLNRGTVVALIKPIESIEPLPVPEDKGPPPSSVPAHLQEMVEGACANLSPEQALKVTNLISEFQDIFVGPNGELGKTDLIKHEIDTGTARPIKQHPRRQAITRRAVVDAEVEKMLEAGAIEPSDSPWASPIVLVTKKDGSTRFCIDYRRLNACTRKDAFPLPRIDDSLDALSGSAWFCTLDLASGYWQVPVAEADKPKTAFCTRNGLFHFRVMPFGLANAPATFERLMELVLKGLTFDRCLVYLDDVIVFGRSFDETLENLRAVFVRMRQANLRLKPSKCVLFRKSVSFLGHTVSDKGIGCDPEKIEAVRSWATPSNATEVRSFLGFASYYRRFIPKFATIASPLHALTGSGKFVWDEACTSAFETLKDKLVSAPILAYPQEEGLFILDTDASNFGIGAVLSQVQAGEEKPVAFASRLLSKSQRRYCTTMKELLAVWRFCNHFRHYLLGRKFLLRTDHKALTWLGQFKEPDGMLARWIAALAAFDYSMEHRPGTKHGNADGLSRRKCARPDCPDCQMDDSDDEIGPADLVNSVDTQVELLRGEGYPGKLEDDAHDIPYMWLDGWSRSDIQMAQGEDPVIAWFLEIKLKGLPCPPRSHVNGLGPGAWALFNRFESLVVNHGILYFKQSHPQCPSMMSLRLVTPISLRKSVFKHLHSSKAGGHLGVNRSLSKVQNEFFWPGLSKDVERWCSWCADCARSKPGRVPNKANLQQQPVGFPLERMAVDLMGPLPMTKNGNLYIVVIADYFTKWAEAFPLPDKKSYTVAEAIVTEVICRLGTPHRLHSDQGGEFESHLMRDVCQLLDVGRTRTTPYRPQSDGFVERLNRTIKQMLKVLVNENRDDWDDHLPYVMMAYRATPQKSTGCTPNLMMYGREIRLPVEVMAGATPPDTPQCAIEYVEWVRNVLFEAFAFARRQLKTSAERQKKAYDNGLPKLKYSAGDWVWYLYKPFTDLVMKCPWVGPCKVIRTLGEVNVEIQTGPAEKPKVVHVDYLKRYSSDSTPEWTTKCDEGDLRDANPSPNNTSYGPCTEPKVSESDSASSSEEEQASPEPVPSHIRSRRNRRRPARFDDYEME